MPWTVYILLTEVLRVPDMCTTCHIFFAWGLSSPRAKWLGRIQLLFVSHDQHDKTHWLIRKQINVVLATKETQRNVIGTNL